MRIRKCYLFTCFYSKGVSHHHLVLPETQRQAEEWENFLLKKRKGFRCALIGDWGVGNL